MRLSNVIENTRKDLLEIADLTYVLILRTVDENNNLDILQLDLSEITKLQSSNDVLLKPNDKILVFSKNEGDDFGNVRLEELAFTEDELALQEKARWDKRIEEKLFWKKLGVGVNDEAVAQNSFDNQPLVMLSSIETKNILKFKDTGYFSRVRMLAPVIQKLREQAKYGNPLKIVEIAGQVKAPGLYPLSNQASAKSLIKAAGGLTESSYLKKSEITRTEIADDGTAQVSHISFSLSEVLSDNNSNDISLVSKDRINIFSIPSWQEELKVSVKGEVQFPGVYTFRRGETLSDLLNRVGSLTQYGDSNAVIFTREGLKVQEKKNLEGLSEELRKQIASESLRSSSNAGSIVSYDEAKKLLQDLSSTEAVGRLVIDFQSVLDGVSETAIVLEDGDILYVPIRSQSVNVIGEVYVPTSHIYKSNVSFEDYIARSGGYRSLADKDKVYIIRANGSVYLPGGDDDFWFSGNNELVGILPGDTIVVPFDTENVDNLTLWSSATQVIYQLAVAVAAIGSL
jgi:protein involved in polysaccharide export with SLBB domain